MEATPLACAITSEEEKQRVDVQRDLLPIEVSAWVLQRIDEVSKLVGISFDGFEHEAKQLFTAIEQK